MTNSSVHSQFLISHSICHSRTIFRLAATTKKKPVPFAFPDTILHNFFHYRDSYKAIQSLTQKALAARTYFYMHN